MTKSTSSLIESSRSAEACGLFFDHFRMDPSDGDPLLLERLIHNFAKLPYENLSKIIKSGGDADSKGPFRFPDEVIKDHMAHRLGGTCFSLTFFLERLLKHVGFDCYKVMADMKAGKNIHCAVVMRLKDGEFLVDPGYGLNRPIALNESQPVRFVSRHGGIEVGRDAVDGRFHLITYVAKERKWRYSFTNSPVSEKDFERYWIESFSRSTLNQICLYRVSQHGRLYLHKNHLRVSTFRGQRKENVRKNLHHTVETHFGIGHRWVEEAASVLERKKAAWSDAKEKTTES